MRQKHFLLPVLWLWAAVCFGQKEKQPAITDTTVYDYDEIFSELDALLDSLYTPRSFGLANLGFGSGFFQYGAAATATTKRQIYVSPSAGYYHKSGLGITAGASLLNYEGNLSPYQYLLTGSYDYLKTRDFITGLSYSYHFTKDRLPFYTSPLQSEAYGYFTWRKSWLRPSLSASYGWGSRQSLSAQKPILEKLKKLRRNNAGGSSGSGPAIAVVNTYEKVVDFNLQFSLRHDFYVLDLLSKTDYLRVTPLLSFIAGSQQFGFHSAGNTILTARRNGKASANTTENMALEDALSFRPLSLAGQVRAEYASGKFFLQPQVYFDYYLPANSRPFTTTFLLNIGMIL